MCISTVQCNGRNVMFEIAPPLLFTWENDKGESGIVCRRLSLSIDYSLADMVHQSLG